MDIIPQPLKVKKSSFWPLLLSFLLFFYAGGCGGTSQESRPSPKIVRERVAKADFNNDYLVLLLIKEELLETDFSDSKYVYFNSWIENKEELIRRLNHIGIGETTPIVRLWLASLKTGPLPAPDKPEEIKKLLVKGNAYSDLGHFNKGLELYKEAFDKYQSPDAAYNIAVTLETNLNRPKEAMPYYVKFIMLEKKGDDVEQAKVWLRALQKQFERQRDLSLILKQKPKKTTRKDLKTLLANRRILYENKLTDSHLKEIKEAMEAGAKAYAKDDFVGAIKEYEKVLRLYDNPDACYNLGVIYDKKLEKYEDALFFYEHYLKAESTIVPADSEVPKAIKRLKKILEESGQE